jgi:hypothetical protein
VKVGILSKGVSLLETWPNVGPMDATIAVNDALSYFPRADWLCMTDLHKLQERAPHLEPMFGLSPRVGVVTAECYMHIAHELFSNLCIVGSDHIKRIGHDNVATTFLLALWFAQQDLQATEIEIHGLDLGGPNLHQSEDRRADRRWPDERKTVSSVINSLRETGITVTSKGLFQP